MPILAEYGTKVRQDRENQLLQKVVSQNECIQLKFAYHDSSKTWDKSGHQAF